MTVTTKADRVAMLPLNVATSSGGSRCVPRYLPKPAESLCDLDLCGCFVLRITWEGFLEILGILEIWTCPSFRYYFRIGNVLMLINVEI